QIAPTEFVNKAWYSVLRFVPEWVRMPSAEEAWLSLEDLCVQREILRDIQSVNQMVAGFLPAPVVRLPDEPKPPAKAKDDSEEEKARFAADKEKYDKLKKEYDAEVAKYAAEKAKVEQEVKASLQPPPKDGDAVGRFISPNWQLDLAISRAATGKAGEL